MPRCESPPTALRSHEQWVCWRFENEDKKKPPVTPTNGAGYARTDDSDTWTSYATAKAYHERQDTDTEGVGLILTNTDRLAAVDLDDCRDPTTGAIEPWARFVVDRLGSYTEVSPSGTGLHVFVLGSLPPGADNRADVDGASGHIEMYDNGRFLTFTGNRLDGTSKRVTARSDAFEAVHGEYVAESDEGADNPCSTPREFTTGDVSLGDRELLNKARNARNGKKFTRLYDRGDTSGYPSHSEARMALLNMLAFWTGKDHRQIDRLYRDSALHPHPEKPGVWDRLGGDEIRKAIQNCSDTYSGSASSVVPQEEEGSVSSDGGRAIVGRPIIGHVADALREIGPATTAEITEYPTVDRSRKQVERSLQYLEGEGIVGWERRGRSVKYRLVANSDRG